MGKQGECYFSKVGEVISLLIFYSVHLSKSGNMTPRVQALGGVS